MDKKFFGGWFVIVGRNFGLDVTHEEGTFLQAVKGPLQFVIFRCSNWFYYTIINVTQICLNIHKLKKIHFIFSVSKFYELWLRVTSIIWIYIYIFNIIIADNLKNKSPIN